MVSSFPANPNAAAINTLLDNYDTPASVPIGYRVYIPRNVNVGRKFYV